MSSQTDWEDEDVEIGSVQREDLFNLRQLSAVTDTTKDGKRDHFTKKSQIEIYFASHHG